MNLQILHDKKRIEGYLSKNVLMNIYSIGDLDDFFWNYTTWYAAMDRDEIQSLILSYAAPGMATVIAISDDVTSLRELLTSITPLLPRRFYSHLNVRLDKVLSSVYRLEPHGRHYKMGLARSEYKRLEGGRSAIRLTEDDLDDIYSLYKRSYPGNWFDERMLQTNQYYGIYVDGRLVSIGGIHVYSERYRVSAVGNVTTDSQLRNKGYGREVMIKLCDELFKQVDYIGLNVKADNHAAIALYERIGFRKVCEYEEYLAEVI